MKKTWIVILVILIIILIGYFFWMRGNQPAYQQPAATTGGSATQPVPALVLNTATDPTLGTYLVAANGMTLYTFANDKPGISNCIGVCATNWPPYSVTATTPLTAASGITGTLDTITRADGSMQLTYNSIPLYFWHLDSKPGDTTGNGFGGVWFVAKP